MEKELHKLAVIFPGIGYTADKPLLYFGRRIAVEYGYEVRIMDYKGFPPKVKGDRNRMEESFFIALRQAEEMLAGVDFTEYDDIVFIGKSIGTIVAAKIAADSSAKARIRQVLYTPLEDTFRFPIGEATARFSTRRWKILSDFRSEKRLLLPAMTIRGSAKKTAGFPRSAKSGAFHAAWSLTRTTRWRARMFSRI